MAGVFGYVQRYSGGECPDGPAALMRSQLTCEADEAPDWTQMCYNTAAFFFKQKVRLLFILKKAVKYFECTLRS